MFTVTSAKPNVARRLASTVAVSCPELTKTVGSAAPFHSAVEALVKFVPFTVSVRVDAPLKADCGAREDKIGVGLKAEPVTAVDELAVLLTVFGSG